MSDYGRVPESTPPYLADITALVGRIAGALPGSAPGEWGRIAYRTILSGVLKDWVDHGTEGLSEQDADDLTALTRLAAQTALAVDYSRRDDTFIVVIGALIDDWVRNWNVSNGESEDEE